MNSTFRFTYKWEAFSEQYLPLILQKQKELYALNFENMIYDEAFYANITQWYTVGVRNFYCFSRLLFTKQDELIGFYLFQLSRDTSYLMQLFVEENYRQKGYGKILLNKYEQASIFHKASTSFLHASKLNATAVSFYEHNGYSTMSQELDEQGNERYLMFKPLLLSKSSSEINEEGIFLLRRQSNDD